MANQARRYQGVEIETANPVELVLLLYDAAIASLQKAQGHMAARDIANRTQCINKAMAILTELQANLDFGSGGEIAGSLDKLYRYVKDRIFDANLRQDTAPLKESVRLLGSLREAWFGVAQADARKSAGSAKASVARAAAAAMPMTAGSQAVLPSSNLNVTA
jgi:flagellar protein FliS